MILNRVAILHKMADPVAVFHHSDLHRECVSERKWQKLNVGRASHFQSDSSGRFCAIYSNWSTIEIWDFSSIPVPLTSLLLPKSLATKHDGFCYSLVWSANSQIIVGVFGTRPSAQKFSEFSKSTNMLVWNIADRDLLHHYKLPFPVDNLSPAPVDRDTAQQSEQSCGSPYYIMSTGSSAQLLLINTASSRIRCVSAQTGAVASTVWMLPDQTKVEHDVRVQMECAESFEALKQWWLSELALHGGHRNVNNSNGSSTSRESAIQKTLLHCSGSRIYALSSSVNPPLSDMHTDSCNAKCSSLDYCSAKNPDSESVAFSLTSFQFLIRPGRKDSEEVDLILLQSYPLSASYPVTALSTDSDCELLNVTLEAGGTLLFSTSNGSINLIGHHETTDQSIAELLNTHSAGFKMRSSSKLHTSAGKRQQHSVLYGALATFKTSFSGFLKEMTAHSVENTRFTNDLRPYEILPLSSSTHKNDHGYSKQTLENVVRTTSATSSMLTNPPTERITTSLVYSVLGNQRGANGPSPCHLIIGDLAKDFSLSAMASASASASASGSESASGDVQDMCASVEISRQAQLAQFLKNMRVVTLPSGEITQIAVSGCSVGETSRRSCRRPPRQTIMCVDSGGFMYLLRPKHSTDFPGPMYPIGYTLITKVIGYLEQEDELDNPAAASANKLVHSSANSQSDLLHSAHSGGSSVSALAPPALASATLQYDSTADNLSKGSSVRSSTESLLGLSFLEEHPTDGGTTHVVNVSDLVIGSYHHGRSSRGRNIWETPIVPFTYAEDWLLNASAQLGGFNAGLKRVVDLVSPSRGKFPVIEDKLPLSPAGTERVTTSPLSKVVMSVDFAEHNNINEENGSAMDNDARELVAGHDAGNNGNEKLQHRTLFPGGMENFLPVPVRVRNGDFEAKLLRQHSVTQAYRDAALEPDRLRNKVVQIQEEAVAAAYHAREVAMRKRARTAQKKEEEALAQKRKKEEKEREIELRKKQLLEEKTRQQQDQDYQSILNLVVTPSLQPDSSGDAAQKDFVNTDMVPSSLATAPADNPAGGGDGGGAAAATATTGGVRGVDGGGSVEPGVTSADMCVVP